MNRNFNPYDPLYDRVNERPTQTMCEWFWLDGPHRPYPLLTAMRFDRWIDEHLIPALAGWNHRNQ